MSHFPITLGIKVFSLIFVSTPPLGDGGVGGGGGGLPQLVVTKKCKTKTHLRIHVAFSLYPGHKSL